MPPTAPELFMSTPTSAAEAGAPRERRQHLRISFSSVRRPHLHLAGGVHDVIDASLGGLRIRHAESARPQMGQRLIGLLEWPGEEVPAAFGGPVVRVQPTDVAIACDLGDLSLAYLLAESARRRESFEGHPAEPGDAEDAQQH